MEQSLLHQLSPEDDDPRFGMLELLREYALEQLQANAALTQTCCHHALFLLDLVSRADPGLWGPKQEGWLRRLDLEYDNLRTALAWCLDSTDEPEPFQADAPIRAETLDRVEIGLRIAERLWHYWVIRSCYEEGRTWIAAVLTMHGPGATSARARALSIIGKLAELQGDAVWASQFLEEVVELHRNLDNQEGMAAALLFLGRTARDRGDYAQAERLERECLALFRRAQAHWGVIYALFSLGDVMYDQGDLAQAEAYFQEALAVAQHWGVSDEGATAHLNLGRIAQADAAYRESQRLFESLNAVWGRGETVLERGWLELARGNNARAATYFSESLALFHELGGRHLLAAGCEGMATLAAQHADPACAARLFGAAAALREALHAPLPDSSARLCGCRCPGNRRAVRRRGTNATVGWRRGAAHPARATGDCLACTRL
jgi:non-specific serine/threonine protein kinase